MLAEKKKRQARRTACPCRSLPSRGPSRFVTSCQQVTAFSSKQKLRPVSSFRYHLTLLQPCFRMSTLACDFRTDSRGSSFRCALRGSPYIIVVCTVPVPPCFSEFLLLWVSNSDAAHHQTRWGGSPPGRYLSLFKSDHVIVTLFCASLRRSPLRRAPFCRGSASAKTLRICDSQRGSGVLYLGFKRQIRPRTTSSTRLRANERETTNLVSNQTFGSRLPKPP